MSLTVNDRTYDSGKGEIRFGSTAVALKKIGFGDKLNKELVRRFGSQEIEAITEGEYETDDVTVEIELSIWNLQVHPNLPQNGYGNFEFVITLHYTDELMFPVKIQLLHCTFAGEKDSAEAGPGAAMKEVSIKCRQIVRNGKTLNRRKLANPPDPDTMNL